MALSRNFVVPFFLYHLLLLNPADSSCRKSFKCGNHTMEFPFTHIRDPNCGLIMVNGCDSEQPMIIPQDGSTFNYTLLNTTSPNKLAIRHDGLQHQLGIQRCIILRNVSLSRSPSLSFTFSGSNLTMFTCSNQTRNDQIENSFHGYSWKQCEFAGVYYNKTERSDVPTAVEGYVPAGCTMVQLPINPGEGKDDLFDLLAAEFTVEWRVAENCLDCYRRGGQCVTSGGNEFFCKEGKSFLLTDLGCECVC